MTSDLIVSFAAAFVFFIAAARFGIAAHYSRLGRLPFKSKLGIRHQDAHASEEAWVKAHSAAWVLFAMGAAISSFHGIAVALAPLVEEISLRTYNMVLILAGGIVIFAISILAEKAGVAALQQ